MKITSLLILRIGLGINMLMHGLVRIPQLQEFAEKTALTFHGTFLPFPLIKLFLLVLPFMELATGLLIIFGGKWSRNGFVLCGIILCLLLFGTTLKEDWNTAGLQLIYMIAVAYGLSLYNQDNEKSTAEDR
ncbi:DoxX family protein (plasmid) [Pedobacter sp. BS3]|uniref:DoxX family protein n=1 Tax=Pedobacter sp. BS3 TaxID=2567937 RepID=UPI0011ED56D5|nr:DoxX family protein [Pedobacter sp. BS3]TZF86325.1 DoxX family protein [Pedobacter sp. BS3]